MQQLPFYWVSPSLVTELHTLLSYKGLQGGPQDPISTDEKSKPQDNEFLMQSTQSWIPMHAGLFPPIRFLHGDFKSTLRLKSTSAIWGGCGPGMPGPSNLDALLVRMTKSRCDCVCFLPHASSMLGWWWRLRGHDEGLVGASQSWSYSRITWTAFKNHQCPDPTSDQFSQNLEDKGTRGHLCKSPQVILTSHQGGAGVPGTEEWVNTKKFCPPNFAVLLDSLFGGQDSGISATGLSSSDHSCLLNR